MKRDSVQADRRYYRPDEVANHFQVSVSYVYSMIRKRQVQSVRIGRLHRIPRKEYCRMCRGTGACQVCSYGIDHL